MKTTIKIFLAFRSFSNWRSKIGPFLVTRYIKSQSYQNMSLSNKSWSPFFNEIKIWRISPIFDIEKWLWRSELCRFWPWILKWPKGQKYFYDHFHKLTKLKALVPQLNSAACRKISLVTLGRSLSYRLILEAQVLMTSWTCLKNWDSSNIFIFWSNKSLKFHNHVRSSDASGLKIYFRPWQNSWKWISCDEIMHICFSSKKSCLGSLVSTR